MEKGQAEVVAMMEPHEAPEGPTTSMHAVTEEKRKAEDKGDFSLGASSASDRGRGEASSISSSKEAPSSSSSAHLGSHRLESPVDEKEGDTLTPLLPDLPQHVPFLHHAGLEGDEPMKSMLEGSTAVPTASPLLAHETAASGSSSSSSSSSSMEEQQPQPPLRDVAKEPTTAVADVAEAADAAAVLPRSPKGSPPSSPHASYARGGEEVAEAGTSPTPARGCSRPSSPLSSPGGSPRVVAASSEHQERNERKEASSDEPCASVSNEASAEEHSLGPDATIERTELDPNSPEEDGIGQEITQQEQHEQGEAKEKGQEGDEFAGDAGAQQDDAEEEEEHETEGVVTKRIKKDETEALKEEQAEDEAEDRTEGDGQDADVHSEQAEPALAVKEEPHGGDDKEEEAEVEEDGRGPPPPKGSEVFVGALHRDATEDHVREVFAKIGDIYEIRLMKDPKTGQSKGYAFVRYMEPTFAELAADQLNGYLILGRPIGVLVSQDNQSLFVGHISKDWTLEQLQTHLKDASIQGVDHVIFQNDPSNPTRNRGFVFIEFQSHHQAARAHGKMTRTDFRLGGQKVRVDWAEPLNDPGEDVMAQVKSIYVANLPLEVDNELITNLFGEYGKIERIVLSKNLPTARRKDFAFVNYVERESALKAIEAKNGFEVQGRNLNVTLAKPVEDATKQGKKGKGWKGAATPERPDGRRDMRAGSATARPARAESTTRGGRRPDSIRGSRDGKGHRGARKQLSPEDEMPYPPIYEIEGPGVIPTPYAVLVPVTPIMPSVMTSMPPAGGAVFRCELCKLSLNSENQLQQHYQGRQHFKALQVHQHQLRNAGGYGYHSPHPASPQSASSPSNGKRKRIPPAGHQGFARNPRQRSDDYDAIPPPPPMPYGQPGAVAVAPYPATPSVPVVVPAGPSGAVAPAYHYPTATYAAPSPAPYYAGYDQTYTAYPQPSAAYAAPGYGAQYPYPQPSAYSPAPAYATPTRPVYPTPPVYVPYVPTMPPSAGAAGAQRYPTGYETMQWS